MENKKLSYMPPEAEIVLLYPEGICVGSDIESPNYDYDEWD